MDARTDSTASDRFTFDVIENALQAVSDEMFAAMRKTAVDSPRGKFTLSPAGNPVQDMYLREAKGNNNEFKAVAVKGLADPARGCKM